MGVRGTRQARQGLSTSSLFPAPVRPEDGEDSMRRRSNARTRPPGSRPIGLGGLGGLGVLAVLVPMLSSSCQANRSGGEAGPSPVALETTVDLGSMTNVCVCGELWLGGGPEAEDLELAARRGVEQIIDLCADGELGFDARALCEREGIDYLHIPIDLESLDETGVDRVLEALRLGHGRRTLMFSKSGSDAAMLFAIHRAVHGGLAVEAALAEGRRAGMKPGAPEEVVKTQVSRIRLAG